MADVEGLGGVWAPGNALREKAAAALDGPLKLVHLMSLDLSGAWHAGACVLHAVPCPSVRERLCQCEPV